MAMKWDDDAAVIKFCYSGEAKFSVLQLFSYVVHACENGVAGHVKQADPIGRVDGFALRNRSHISDWDEYYL